MTKRAVQTDGAPAPKGAYSQGVVANGFLFTAGLGPHHPETGEVVGSEVETQTERTIDNLEAVLAAAGLGLADVVKSTIHLADVRGDFAGFNAVYQRRFPSPYPVRTTVGSDLLGILVEIDVVAALPT
jgi:2-iminobutanoate/2-iminopropanoate deaminase